MATQAYEVINVDELTVLQTVTELPQADGSVKYQNGMGRTYVEGERVDPDLVATDWKKALEEADESNPLYLHLKDKLKPVADEPAEDIAMRLGLPFPGYDDMEVDEIVAAMRVLPSATIQRIKTYESNRGADARTEIVDYNIGFGEHPNERQLADPEESEVYDETKAVRQLTTREVPDEGPVRSGEGITGTGDPQKPYGVVKAAEEGDEEAAAEAVTSKNRGGGAIGKAKKASSSRSSRRSRTPKPAPSTGEGGSSIQSTNE